MLKFWDKKSKWLNDSDEILENNKVAALNVMSPIEFAIKIGLY